MQNILKRNNFSLWFNAATPYKKLELELRGVHGRERIDIYSLGSDGIKLATVELTEDWREFSYPVEGVRIYFHDNGDVYLRNPHLYHIKIMNMESWNCDTEGADHKCNKVQSGAFAWKGNYLVQNKGTLLIIRTLLFSITESLQLQIKTIYVHRILQLFTIRMNKNIKGRT